MEASKQLLYLVGLVIIVALISYYAGHSSRSDSEKIKDINADVSRQLDSLTAVNQKLEAERAASEQRVDSLDASIVSLQNGRQATEESIKILKNSLSSKDASISRLKQSLGEKDVELVKLRSASSQLEATLREADDQLKALLTEQEKQQQERWSQYDSYTYRRLHDFLNERVKQLGAERQLSGENAGRDH